MEEQMELHELRIHRLEQLTTSMIDSQSTMVQLLQEHSNRLSRIESRLDRVEQRIDNVEKQLELVLTDLAFIKEILLRPK